MKKIISMLIVLVMLGCALVSCGSGVSVPYYTLAMDNYTMNVFDVYAGVKETVTYYKNGEVDFEYSVYIDKGFVKDGNYYNVCESYEGYNFYAYDEELYVVTGGKTYAVIQADKSSYVEYVEPYEEREHQLDAGEKYQKYSKTLESGETQVSYYAKVTPLMAAELYQYGITETDTLLSTYILMEDTDFYMSIEYTLEHADGTTEKIAERKFEYYETVEENANIFAALPTLEETVSVSIVYENGTKDTFKIPKGVYVGIDAGEENISYYTDASFENAFDFESALASEDMTIYAKNN